MRHRVNRPWAASIPAPAIASLNYDQGDTAGGGASIVITGTDLGSASAVTIGGNSATITGNTSTTVTFTLPAHAAGSVTVSVTTPGGTSGTLAFEYWDLTTPAAPLADYLDDYAGVPSPNAGSGLGNLDGATAPTVASNVLLTHDAADFDGTTSLLSDNFVDDMIPPSSDITIVGLAYFRSAMAAPADVYDDAGIMSDPYFNLGFTDAGIGAAAYGGGWPSTLRVPCPTGAWAFFAMTLDASDLTVYVGGTSDSVASTGQLTRPPGAYNLSVGASAPSVVSLIDGQLARLATYGVALSAADVAKARKYFAQRYGASV